MKVTFNKLCAAILFSCSATALAGVSSNMPEEGVIPVMTLPEDVANAAKAQCTGLLINKATFRWKTDVGMYTVEGRCGGRNVRILVTGEGRVEYFARLEDR